MGWPNWMRDVAKAAAASKAPATQPESAAAAATCSHGRSALSSLRPSPTAPMRADSGTSTPER